MTDLTDRMRTCAAYLIGAEKAGDGGLRDFGRAIIDAADLLIEASNALEAAPAPLGEPMEVIPPIEPGRMMAGTWVAASDTLPVARPRPLRACPKCDSRAAKTVRRDGNRLMLVCPVCAETWEFKR